MKMEMNKNRAIKKQNSFKWDFKGSFKPQMTWPQQSWGHTAWVMLPRSCTEVKWIEVKWIEVKWCRYLWLSSGNWGQWVSLSREVNLSLYLSEVKYRSKWGQIRSIFDKLVRLSKFSPWTKIKIQGTKSSYCHASMTFSLFFGCARC